MKHLARTSYDIHTLLECSIDAYNLGFNKLTEVVGESKFAQGLLVPCPGPQVASSSVQSRYQGGKEAAMENPQYRTVSIFYERYRPCRCHPDETIL